MVYELLKDIPGVKTNLPNGAFYFFPDISSYYGKKDGDKEVNNANDFCLYILENAHVSLVLGDAFGDPNCVRLSYAASEEDLKKALTSIKEVLARLK